MMKYALIHSNEFTHPISGFIIGFISFTLVIIIECINLVTIQGRETITGAISVALGYGLILRLPISYMNSIDDFKYKQAV